MRVISGLLWLASVAMLHIEAAGSHQPVVGLPPYKTHLLKLLPLLDESSPIAQKLNTLEWDRTSLHDDDRMSYFNYLDVSMATCVMAQECFLSPSKEISPSDCFFKGMLNVFHKLPQLDLNKIARIVPPLPSALASLKLAPLPYDITQSLEQCQLVHPSLGAILAGMHKYLSNNRPDRLEDPGKYSYMLGQQIGVIGASLEELWWYMMQAKGFQDTTQMYTAIYEAMYKERKPAIYEAMYKEGKPAPWDIFDWSEQVWLLKQLIQKKKMEQARAALFSLYVWKTTKFPPKIQNQLKETSGHFQNDQPIYNNILETIRQMS